MALNDQARLPMVLPTEKGLSIAIIPCTNQKADVRAPAREVWAGGQFQLVLAHAEIHFEWVYVMSYKYGLIHPDQVIDPYDLNIKNATKREQLEWWLKLREQVAEVAEWEPRIVALFTGNFERERFIREWVRNGVRNVLVPWEGLGIGQRIAQVYDGQKPFDEDKLAAGEYMLDERWGESNYTNMKEMAAAKRAEKEQELAKDFEEADWVD